MTTLISGESTFPKRAVGSTARAFSPSRALAAVWAAQGERWLLWLAPAMVAGAAVFVTAPREPPLWIGVVLAAGGVAGAFLLRAASAGGSRWRIEALLSLAWLMGLVAAFGFGVLAGQVRVATVATPAFPDVESPVAVEGWVVAIDPSDAGPRLRLLVRDIEGVTTLPRYVRVAVPAAGVLAPGRAARCRAVLSTPSGPLAPGAYDFARRAWFERLGATGFGIGRCRPAAFAPPSDWLDRERLRLGAVRYDLSQAIQRAAPGRGGAIAAALVTGDRSSIDRETNEALRDSGLGHLLSVSGIHMGVVGGLVFASLLWTLSLIGPIALRYPVKKLAAIGALVALAAYLIVSGSSVPALRAFVMACVAFGAILLDRPAISMRGLALAAVIVVAIFPEAVVEPGFQMSFAATMALVALFEMLHRGSSDPKLPTPGPLIGTLQASVRGIGGVILISAVAGVATDPFAIYHFQRFSVYALPANLIAAPIMSFLVAPAAGIAAVLAPFGLADPALELMASALDLIAAIGATFGGRPEAIRALPQPPDLAFVLCVFAMLWACLWRGALRWVAASPFLAAVALYISAPVPVAAFDADLRAIYARQPDNSWALITGRGRSTYARDRLGAMIGLAPFQIERLAPPETCGETSCVWSSPSGARMALSRADAAFPAGCADARVIITTARVPPSVAALCPGALLFDADARVQNGGAFIYESPAGLHVTRARSNDLQRPWSGRATSDADQE